MSVVAACIVVAATRFEYRSDDEQFRQRSLPFALSWQSMSGSAANIGIRGMRSTHESKDWETAAHSLGRVIRQYLQHQ